MFQKWNYSPITTNSLIKYNTNICNEKPASYIRITNDNQHSKSKKDGLLPLLGYKGTSLLIRWYYKKIMEYIQCNLLQALAALQIPRKY